MSKFKVVNVNQNIIKAIGRKKNMLGLSDTKDTVIFFKNRFDYRKINEKSIIKRLNTDFDVGKELMRFKDDLFMSLSNVNSAFNLNSQLPQIDAKQLNGLRDIQISLKNTDKTKFYLERISDTQKRIYNVLKKIEEDLIDEQDTKIKTKDKEDDDTTDVVPKVGAVAETQSSSVKTPKKALPSGLLDFIKNSLKNVSLASVIRIAGKILKLAEVVMLLYYVAKNWYIADKSINSPGIIEKCIFAIFAGVTEWIEVHLDLFSWLVDNFLEISNWIIDNAHKYSNHLGEYAYIVDIMVNSLKYAPLKFICEYCLKPVFDWLKENGKYGPALGVIAVDMYRANKKAIMNAVPNGKTFDLLFGESKLEEAEKAGIYNWSMLGNSQLRGSAKDIAQIATKQELEEMLEHDDLDESDIKKVKEALKIKEEQNIKDEDVKKLRNTDLALNNMIETLLQNMKFFDSNKEWKKLWVTLAQNSREFVKVNPEATVITFLENDGRKTTLNHNHLLLDNPYFTFTSAVDAPETLCVGVCKEAKLIFNRVTDTFWFTPYGTVVFQSKVTDPIQSKRYVDTGNIKNVKLVRGALLNVYKVMGFFDANFSFVKDFFNPNDLVFKKIFKYNIITNSKIDSVNTKKLVKEDIRSVSEEASSFKRIPSYVANSYVQEESYNELQTTQSNVKITSTEIKKKVWDFFKTELKLKDHQIAGIMGNLDVESGGFNPKHIQGEHFDKSASGKNDGMSGGLCQWHDVNGKGRLSNLKKFASKMGRDWRDLDVQLLFLKYELQTTHKHVLDRLMKCSSVKESATVWVYDFEKPADKLGQSIKRTSIGEGYLNLYQDSEVEPKVSTNEEFKVPYAIDESKTKNIENTNDVNNASHSQVNSTDILGISKSMIRGTVYSQRDRTTKGYYDCSSFVTAVLKRMGFDLTQGLKNAGMKANVTPTTPYFDKILSSIGFRKVGKSTARTKFKDNLQAGDILLKKGKHIMIYNGDGRVIEANGWDGNHNGVNDWGALHNKSDVYEVWRYPNILSSVKSNSSQDLDVGNSERGSQNSVQESNYAQNVNNSKVNTIIVANNKQQSVQEYEGMSEQLFNIKLN